MAIRDPSTLLDGLPPKTRVLGLDLGTRTIGIALSDVERCIATPMETLSRKKLVPDIAHIQAILHEHDVGALVLGLPINMDGSEGPRCQATRQFANDLLKTVDIPLCFWDERLSSRAAEGALLEADVSRKRRKAVIDKVAAAIILQSCLDFLSSRA